MSWGIANHIAPKTNVRLGYASGMASDGHSMGRYSDCSVLLYLGTEIERMGEALGASEETQRDAIRLCGDVLRAEYNYNAVDSVAGACFYLACKRQEEPISLTDIADHSRKSKKKIQHLGANLMNELDIQPRPVEPDTYLEDGVAHFGFTEEQREESFELLERAKARTLHAGLAPTTIAGAILYAVACKHRLGINQDDVADFVGKSVVSIRNNFRDILTLADDVPVDVLPPQTIADALGTLDSHFEDMPAVYTEDAEILLEDAAIDAGLSRAGVAGGAYLAAATEAGASLTAEEVSTAVGVSPQTISKYYRRFTDDD